MKAEASSAHDAVGLLPHEREGALGDDLRRILRVELLKDTCSSASIAHYYSVQRRTLHRRLSAEGLTFRQVAHEVRFKIACELLENTHMALAQVAAVLRYSELSAFTRAFKRWSGQTPSAWRSSRAQTKRSSSRSHNKRRDRSEPENERSFSAEAILQSHDAPHGAQPEVPGRTSEAARFDDYDALTHRYRE